MSESVLSPPEAVHGPQIHQGPVHIVGCGGTGPWCALFIAKGYRAGVIRETPVYLYDKDRVEEKNCLRQLFGPEDCGRFKAVLVSELVEKFYYAEPVLEYLKEDNVAEYIQDGALTFCCVDNHRSRKVLSDHYKTLDNGILVSGGNEVWDGNVQLYVRKDGNDLTPPITFGHPEIEDPQDTPPWENCADASEEDPQIVVANQMVATWMMAAYWQYELPNCWHEVIFDIKLGRVESYKRQETAVV